MRVLNVRKSAAALVALAVVSATAGQVSAAIVNLALNKPVTVTSEYAEATGSEAVDGIGIGGSPYPDIWHSGNDLNPALTINLGNLYALGDDAPAGNADITLSNRTGCCGGRLTGMRIEVWGTQGTAGAPDATVNFDPAGATTFDVELPAVNGQYVRLTKLNVVDPGGDERSINLAEIQVFGDSAPIPEPAALGLLGIGAAGLLARRRCA